MEVKKEGYDMNIADSHPFMRTEASLNTKPKQVDKVERRGENGISVLMT